MSVLEHLIKDVTLEDNNNDLQYKAGCQIRAASEYYLLEEQLSMTTYTKMQTIVKY